MGVLFVQFEDFREDLLPHLLIREEGEKEMSLVRRNLWNLNPRIPIYNLLRNRLCKLPIAVRPEESAVRKLLTQLPPLDLNTRTPPSIQTRRHLLRHELQELLNYDPPQRAPADSNLRCEKI